MAHAQATAAEIDKKLRDDFRRRLKDFGISAETTDPVLAVLFRTLAGQLEALYSEAGRMRLELLDELISGLGIEQRMARPAQTVVRFFAPGDPQFIDTGTELVGEAQSGERLTFTTDAGIAASPARICLGLTYQEGYLQIMPGIELPESLQAAHPSFDRVRASLGPNPAIFLAIQELPPNHLSQHGVFFELSPDAADIQRALLREIWCLAGPNGELGAHGIMRPRRGRVGVQHLEWLVAPECSSSADEQPLELPDGFYAGRVFTFPVVPGSRRFFCSIPAHMEAPLARMFARPAAPLFGNATAWVRISMPREISDLHTGVSSVWLNGISASNVECFNETIYFATHGDSIPISREAGTSKFLVAPLSIFGEGATPYVPEFEASADPNAGRFSIHNGRVQLTPARHPDGKPDVYANLRLWVTSGALGNNVGPGQVQAFLQQGGGPALRISNPTSAAGGTNGETFQDAQHRFAQALFSRDRIVTRGDLVQTIRNFDRRIREASVSFGVRRTPQGLQRVQQIKVVLDRQDFLDPDVEVRILHDELVSHLQERFLYDIDLAVEVAWQ
jgi:hypothetical protein